MVLGDIAISFSIEFIVACSVISLRDEAVVIESSYSVSRISSTFTNHLWFSSTSVLNNHRCYYVS